MKPSVFALSTLVCMTLTGSAAFAKSNQVLVHKKAAVTHIQCENEDMDWSVDLSPDMLTGTVWDNDSTWSIKRVNVNFIETLPPQTESEYRSEGAQGVTFKYIAEANAGTMIFSDGTDAKFACSLAAE